MLEAAAVVHSYAPITGLAGEFLAIADRAHPGTGPDKVLADVAALAVAVIPFCDWAGITELDTRGDYRTVAATDPIARTVDQAQYDLDQGPCRDAAHGLSLHWAEELATTSDWPQFSARAVVTTRVRSVMSVPLTGQPRPTVLNLYSATAGGFTVDTADRANDFAAHTQLLLRYTDHTDKIAHLNRALTTSRLIGTAVGILMYAHRITSDDAFNRIRRASQNTNRKLTDIATDITLTGTLPPTPRPRTRQACDHTPTK